MKPDARKLSMEGSGQDPLEVSMFVFTSEKQGLVDDFYNRNDMSAVTLRVLNFGHRDEFGRQQMNGGLTSKFCLAICALLPSEGCFSLGESALFKIIFGQRDASLKWI